jgi:uncharacterized protein (TIGR04255 family)
MPHRDLKNKPLVEATLEIQWQLREEPAGGIKTDPHYKMLLGRFYERVMDAYPIHETLPAARLPESMVAYSPQHLFRVASGQWPVVQIGPGILSVHERQEYSWKDFVWRCVETASKLVDAYPRPAEFKVEAVRLRYLDAVTFDFTKNNLLDFLRDKFQSNVQLPSVLFQDRHVQPQPISFSWQASFREDTPRHHQRRLLHRGEAIQTNTPLGNHRRVFGSEILKSPEIFKPGCRRPMSSPVTGSSN